MPEVPAPVVGVGGELDAVTRGTGGLDASVGASLDAGGVSAGGGLSAGIGDGTLRGDVSAGLPNVAIPGGGSPTLDARVQGSNLPVGATTGGALPQANVPVGGGASGGLAAPAPSLA